MAGSATRHPGRRQYAIENICIREHIFCVWTVELVPEIEPELRALAAEVRIELLAQARVIERFGPTAGRPRIDTLKGSAHANMKELRFDAGDGVWRGGLRLRSPAQGRSSGGGRQERPERAGLLSAFDRPGRPAL